MPRIKPVDHAAATGAAKELLDGVKAGIGMVPNIFATFVQSPKVLEGYLAFTTALGKGRLSAALREQIALTVAGANRCDYCASAHTVMAKSAGVAADEAGRNLNGIATDTATQAVLGFVSKVVDQRGRIQESDLAPVRNAGFGDGEIVEIIAHIGVNMFTNYFNHIAGTDIDFPLVEAASRQAA